MQRLGVSVAVRLIYGSLGVKGLRSCPDFTPNERNSRSLHDVFFEKPRNLCTVQNNSDICCTTQSLEKIGI